MSVSIQEAIDNFNFKTRPYKHQIDFLKYGIYNNRFLLLDEQGMGKTKECIDLALLYRKLYQYKHCLIICGISTLRFNWANEIRIHSNEEPYIIGQRHDKRNNLYVGTVKERKEDLVKMLEKDTLPYFLIINVETIRNSSFNEVLINCLEKNLIDMILCDEIHKMKNSESKQGKAFLKLQAETMIGMTGTMILNNPLDCYVPLRWLGLEKHNYWQFQHFYCEFGGSFNRDIIRYKHMNQLRDTINKCSIRRLRRDYLDLPDKVQIVEYLEMTEKQERIYLDVLRQVKEEIDLILLSNAPLARLTRLRQVTSTTSILSSSIQESAKLDRVEDIVGEVNGKVLIFSNFIKTCEDLKQRLKKYNPAIYTGDTKNAEKELEKFHNDKTCKVIIGTISKMGTGLTLTEANTVIFIDEPRTKALKDQAEDRAYRIGTTKSVNIITLLCVNTIDEKIHQLVETKGQIADFMIDNIKPEKQADLVKYLLNI